MSEAKSKAALPPLLLTRSQLNLYSPQTPQWLEQSWDNLDRLGYYPVMAQCSRVQRPPPPPHYIAQSRKSQADSSVSVEESFGLGLHSDPVRRVKQLERNIAFMRESHAVVLRSLHLEIDDLKTKNRELVFQLVMNNPSPQALAADKEDVSGETEMSQETTKKIEKLEKEVRKLRNALRDALKVNGTITAQMETMKHNLNYPSKSQSTVDLTTEGNQRSSTPSAGSSPKMEEYSDTLKQIQQLSASSRTKSCKSVMEVVGVANRPGPGRGDWTPGRDRCRRHSDFQPHLPRLPLRANQQNPPPGQQQHQQAYEAQSSASQDGAYSLPTLKKPLFPMLQQQQQGQHPTSQPEQGSGKGEGGGSKGRKGRGSRGRNTVGFSGHHHHQGHHH